MVFRRSCLLILAFASSGLMARADDATAPASALTHMEAEGLSLRTAIQLALLNNRTLEKAGLDRETQQFDLRVAEDEFVPNLNLSSTALYNPVTRSDVRSTTRDGLLSAEVNQRLPTGGRVAIVWTSDGTEITPGGTPVDYDSSLSLRIDQPLLRGGGLRPNLASLRIARLSEAGNILEFRRTIIDTVTRVIFAYRSLLQTKLQLEVTETALQRAKEQMRVNRALVDAGILPPVEIIQTEADIASQEFNVLTARTSLESARFTLIRLLDITRDAALDATDAIELPVFSLTLEQARARAYASRPDYLQAEQALEIAGFNTDVAKNNLLWNLSLTSRYRLDGSDDSLSESIDRTFTRANEDWSVGLTFNVPIGDLTRRQAMMRARSRALKAAIDLVEARENIEIELHDAFRSIELNQQRVRVATVGRELAERKLEIEKGKLQTGRTTNFAVVTFQNDLVRARLNEISAQITYINALNALDQTMGTTLSAWGIRIEDLDRKRPTPVIEPAAATTPASAP